MHNCPDCGGSMAYLFDIDTDQCYGCPICGREITVFRGPDKFIKAGIMGHYEYGSWDILNEHCRELSLTWGRQAAMEFLDGAADYDFSDHLRATGYDDIPVNIRKYTRYMLSYWNGFDDNYPEWREEWTD